MTRIKSEEVKIFLSGYQAGSFDYQICRKEVNFKKILLPPEHCTCALIQLVCNQSLIKPWAKMEKPTNIKTTVSKMRADCS